MVSSQCLFCSTETIKICRKKKRVFEPCAAGLTCSKCHYSTCRRCLIDVHGRCTLETLWYNDVGEFIVMPEDQSPQKTEKRFRKFVGHCCEFKLCKSEMIKRTKQFNDMCEKKKRLDGVMHLFEFDLLVDTGFESTDVIGLGACRSKYTGVVHGIISLETATDLELHEVTPKSWNEVIPANTITIHTVVTVNPFDSTKVKVSRGL